MGKIFIISILSVVIYASYNPFFQENTKQISQKKAYKQTKNIVYKPRPTRKNIDMTYYGFIHTNKGRFALVNFQSKNIILQKNDSLYIDEQIFKIKKITSNYILINDRYSRIQTVYFSSKIDKSNNLW